MSFLSVVFLKEFFCGKQKYYSECLNPDKTGFWTLENWKAMSEIRKLGQPRLFYNVVKKLFVIQMV